MLKKLFAFGSLTISFIMGLMCMVSSVSYFSGAALPEHDAEPIVLGIFCMLIAFALLAGAVAGLAFLVITMIKNKESKIPSFIALGCAGVLILGYCIISSYLSISNIVNYAQAISREGTSYDAYYGAQIFVNVCSLLNSYLISGIVAILAVLSLITFKKKQKEEPAPQQ